MIERIEDPIINKLFEDIVSSLLEKGYKNGGGGKGLQLFINPDIKMFIRDIRGVDDEAFIMIKKYV